MSKQQTSILNRLCAGLVLGGLASLASIPQAAAQQVILRVHHFLPSTSSAQVDGQSCGQVDGAMRMSGGRTS